jgi:hypothetical protein
LINFSPVVRIDETAKVAAMFYSVLGAIYMVKRLFLVKDKED